MSQRRIFDTTKHTRIAHGFGFGSGMGFVAVRKCQGTDSQSSDEVPAGQPAEVPFLTADLNNR
jgi:hypothetical protein